MIARLLAPLRHLFARPALLAVLLGCVTFIVEIALADRKYGTFTGGFGASHVVDTPYHYLMVLLGAGAMHVLFFSGLWLFLSRLHHKRVKGYVLSTNLIMLGGVGFMAAIAAKYELLSYFSDSMSFTLMKNLGGGSIMEAMLYGLHEGGWAVVGAVTGVIGYAFLLWRVMVRDPKVRDHQAPSLNKAKLIGSVVAAPALLLIANTDATARMGNQRFQAFSVVNGALDLATDFDGDGYSWFSGQIDDSPIDSARHPYALDIPNNGIDEDGLGGDLKLGDLPMPMATPRFTGAKPNVIHVVFESARSDLIGKRVHGKPVAPNLEALAAQGSMRPAFSPLGFTTGSLKAMFSGVIEPPMGTGSTFRDFKANGYKIGVFSGQAERFGQIAMTLGADTTADIFIDAEKLKDQRAYGYASLASLKLDEGVSLNEFNKAFGSRDKWQKPNFLYFNFQSAHFPYHHPGMQNLVEPDPLDRSEIKAKNRERVANTYWNALAYADHNLGLLIAKLKQLGVWDNTILIVSGDHGEDLFDGGFLGHGHIICKRQYQTMFVTNRPGYSSNSPMGLVDYRALTHALVEGRKMPERTEPLLLHIGPLDTPAAVGMVEPSGRITILKLDSREVQLGEDAPPVPISNLSGEAKANFDRLVVLWGKERWRHHQSGADAGAGD